MKQTNLEVKMAVIETEIKGIKKSFDSHNDDHKLIIKKLDSLKGDFAGKWVEKVSIGSILALVTAFLVFILK